MWRPRAAASIDPKLPLTAEEGFVLSRVDGASSVTDLAVATGLEVDRVQAILERLASHGAIEPDVQRSHAQTGVPDDIPVLGPEDEVHDDDVVADADAVFDADPIADPDADADAEPSEVANEPSHRALYERDLRALTSDERLGLAKRESGPVLLALCFDPEPKIIHAVLENPNAGLDHARLIAMHHRNPAGLEALVTRADFARDGEVVRRLLRNTQTSDAQLRRAIEPKPMRDVYKIVVSRDVAERGRVRAREILHGKFTRADPQERFDLVWSTEGRALASLPTAPLDARTVQLFCARSITSVMLVQNLAKWRSTPPQLLTHLLKQPLVRRQPGLRKLVLAHPNVPADVKRRGGV